VRCCVYTVLRYTGNEVNIKANDTDIQLYLTNIKHMLFYNLG